MYRTALPKSISAGLIDTLIMMDHAAFAHGDWIEGHEAALIYTSKPDCLTLLYKDEAPIGFLSAFSINEALANGAISKDTPIYKQLDSQSLSDPACDAVYIHCILLLPQHRRKDLIYALYKGFKAWLEIRVGGPLPVYSEAVSDEGITALGRMGFSTVYRYKDDSLLQKTDRNSLIERLEQITADKDWLPAVEV
ncbi:MAG: hypothetical protein FWE32_05170 [Oscillospiraceae bacterium]|nr:hypothetical protein [Oscillospiraceae bacterium]